MVDRVTRIDLPGRQWKAPQGNISETNQRMPCFVAGPENRLVVVAIESLLNNNSRSVNFSPLVLLGPTGCGKSHLAGGIANHLDVVFSGRNSQTRTPQDIPTNLQVADFLTSKQTTLHDLLNPQLNRQNGNCEFRQVAYLSSGEFCRLYQQALEQNRLADLRLAMSRLRLLVLENLHQMRLRHEIQQELLLTIDKLLSNGAMVLVTSQQPITMIHSLARSLRDRLSSGLSVHIKPLGTAARLELLQLAADRRGTDLDLNSARRLAKQVEGSTLKLFQALILFEQQQTQQQPPVSSSSALTSKVPDFCAKSHRGPFALQKHITMRQIITVLARYFSISQHQLRGNSRRRTMVHARGVAVYLARLLTDLSYAQIGHHLGNRDHTTTMHAHRKVQQLLTTDSLTQECIDDLKRILEAV